VADEIEVQVPNMRYDITIPFCDGRVEIEGVKLLRGAKSPGGGTAYGTDSPIASGDFGITDFNWGGLLPGIERGDQIVALPVFTKRKPVFTYVYTRADANINTPKDLEGKKVWSSLTGSAIGMWLKGLLVDRYGVDVDKITWVVSRDPYPVYKEWSHVERFEGRKGVVEVLADGDADALMTDISDGKAWDTLENDPRFKRLWPNYIEEDLKLYKETGIYTPVHCIAMSKKLDQAHPELAMKIYEGFEKAKQIARDDIMNDRAGFSVVNLREALVEQEKTWGDPFKHGFSANKNTIDTFFKYNYDYGIVKDRYDYEQVFAKSTLDT
jgi:4,5-dihydroxyphthalate decarboxylase